MNTLAQKIKNNDFAFIAEIGVNYYDIAGKHSMSLMDAAKLMCYEAKEAGADAAKFQSYKAETLSMKDSPAYWDITEEATKSQFELFKKFDSFGKIEYQELSAYCESIGIEFCSTPFDFESADYLYSLMNVYKISSSDLTNIPFIEYQAAKGKPLILSVGAADAKEIDCAISAIRKISDAPLAILHCVLEYPTPYSDANLNRIVSLKEKYPDLTIGYSDHCCPDENANVIKVAYALGARIIEKHFTLDKTLPGNDHYHAADPDDVRKIIKEVKFVEALLGNKDLIVLEEELAARSFARRSIVSSRPIAKGSVIKREDVCFKRPGTGIAPYRIIDVLGKTALCDIEEDMQIEFTMIG